MENDTTQVQYEGSAGTEFDDNGAQIAQIYELIRDLRSRVSVLEGS